MEDLSRLLPRLGNDAVFLPSRGGAYFRNDGGSFTLMEEGTYELTCRLVPQLTGRLSLEDICRQYEPAWRPKIVWLVHQLLDRGIVRNEHRRRSTPLPEATRVRFSSQLALIDHLADDPEGRFERFRESQVLLIGWGVSFWSCAAALIRNGLPSLWAQDLDGTHRREGMSAVRTEVQALGELGIRAEVCLVPIGQGISGARPEGRSLVLYVADSPSVKDLAVAGRISSKESCPVIPGFVLDRQILLGPRVNAPGCLICVFHRLLWDLFDRSRIQLLSQRMGENGGRLATPGCSTLARRLGGDVAFEAFKSLAGRLRPEIESGLILQTFSSDDHLVKAAYVPYTLHGCLRTCGRLAAKVRGEAGEPARPTDTPGLGAAAGRPGDTERPSC